MTAHSRKFKPIFFSVAEQVQVPCSAPRRILFFCFFLDLLTESLCVGKKPADRKGKRQNAPKYLSQAKLLLRGRFSIWSRNFVTIPREQIFFTKAVT